MSDYRLSSQKLSWQFDTALLESCRARANSEARERFAVRLQQQAAAAAAAAALSSSGNEQSAPADDDNALSLLATPPAPRSSSPVTVISNQHQHSQNDQQSSSSSIPMPPVQSFAITFSSAATAAAAALLANSSSSSSSSSSSNDDTVMTDTSSSIINAPASAQTSTNNTSENDKLLSLFLTPQDEQMLIRFYCSIIPSICGPSPDINKFPKLRRNEKVQATAAQFFRRFYLSNSVAEFDPKPLMVASIFLASKVEDMLVDVLELEAATRVLDSFVSESDILLGEVRLLQGLNYQLYCFHSLKPLAALVQDAMEAHPEVSSLYNAAKELLEDACLSDIPLLHPPSKIGLAALVVSDRNRSASTPYPPSHTAPAADSFDFAAYIKARFTVDATGDVERHITEVSTICDIIAELKQGNYGSVRHGIDRPKLKEIRGRLKKTSVWGKKSSKGSKKKDKGTAADAAATTVSGSSKRKAGDMEA
jgi:cyclin ccl1